MPTSSHSILTFNIAFLKAYLKSYQIAQFVQRNFAQICAQTLVKGNFICFLKTYLMNHNITIKNREAVNLTSPPPGTSYKTRRQVNRCSKGIAENHIKDSLTLVYIS